MTTVHLITTSVSPQSGGMQEAALRVARAISRSHRRVVVYTLRQSAEHSGPDPSQQGLEVVHLGERRGELMEPLGPAPPDYSSLIPGAHATEAFRCDYLLLHGEIAASIGRDPTGRHVLASFFASSNGYVAQQVALALGLPHIASVRGSDFHRDVRSPFLHQSLRFLAENAALVVTTNREQERFLASAFTGRCAYRTIHNALDKPFEGEYWKPSGGAEARLVADCGFSVKKATHLLIRSAASLIDEGMPVSLTVLGGTEAKEEPYWRDLLGRIGGAYGERVRFPGWAPPDEAAKVVAQADIHCSASLGEGCSNSQMRALAWGMPIVSTRTGVLPELAEDCSHVRLCAPASPDAFTETLRCAVEDLLGGRMTVDRGRVEDWRRHFSPEREAADWADAVEAALA